MEAIMEATRHIGNLCILIPLTVVWSMSPIVLSAQSEEGRYPSDTLLAAARDIMEAARYCALVTLDETGQPTVRTMDPFEPGDDMVVWFGTNRRSRKVEHIRNDPRVAIHYLAPEGDGYVTIMGTARIVDEPSVKARYWKDEWEQFYTGSREDYVTIAVTPETLEVLDYSKGVAGAADTWKVPYVSFRPEKPGG
jgi:general stress protein 26